MKKIKIANTGMEVSEISLGCMRIAALSKGEAEKLIRTALDEGINYFDHADIYGKGKSEEIFSEAIDMNTTIREKMYIQSKCGINQKDGNFDFSKEYILNSVDGILKRLKTDYLDALLLHRPDALVEPEEVGEAFRILKDSGKVRNFGVSNHNSLQIELLQRGVDEKLVFNQLQLSITNSGMIRSGLNVNMENEAGIDRDGSVLDYCRLNDITIQTWSPFQFGFFEGVFLNNDKYPELNKKIDEIARAYGVTNTTIAMAWILRHPAKMQGIAGTTNPERLKEICKASEITLTRKEWYDIFKAAGNTLP